MSGPICMQTIWHSNGIPEIIFWKSWFDEKKKNEKFLVGKELG